MWPAFRASLPSLYYIGIGNGLGVGDRPWTDWGYDPTWPDFDYQINVGDYANIDLSKTTWTPFGTLCDLLVHEMTHVWQYAHGRQVKGSSVWASTFGSYDFTPGDAWIDYNVEQQASIVEKWHHRGMHKDDELFPYIYGVIWVGGDDASIRKTLAELKARDADVPDVPTVDDPTPPPKPPMPTRITVESIDSVLVPLLAKRYAANDVAGFSGRVKQLETLFRGLDQLQAFQLLPRLSVRRNGDQASMYFYDNLSPSTRENLLKILRGIALITV
jgi:hypothetical protein